MSEVSIDREKALTQGCRIFQQFTRTADKATKGIVPGQNIEALRIGLLRLRRLFPDDFNAELDKMIEDGNEGGKPD